MWTIMIAAIAVWLLLEGLLYAIAPDAMRQFGAWLAQLPDEVIRQSGMFSVLLGALLLYGVLRFGT